MGLVYMGPPHDLALRLRFALGIGHFIETGTFEGRTAAWAAEHFERVTTIEYSRSLYATASQKYANLSNIEFAFGDSRTALRSLAPTLGHTAMFWLDSHFSGGATYGESDECPLLRELDALRDCGQTHVLMIDDARLFSSPPPAPLRMEQWPALPQVFDAIRALDPRYYIVVIDDAIVAVPPPGRDIVRGYCRDRNTAAWQSYARSA